MESLTLALVAAIVFSWEVVGSRLERRHLSGPIVFVGVGGVLGALDLLEGPWEPEGLMPLVEITLVWVLFGDAARLRFADARRDGLLYARTLGVGLPLTVLAGFAVAYWLFPAAGMWLALLLAAALAPTDAALGMPVVANPAVPGRIRRLLTVESGLNDGFVAPVVVLAIAQAAALQGPHHGRGIVGSLGELALGAAVGVAVGLLGGATLMWSRRRGWSAGRAGGVAVLVLAVVAYAAALSVGGNGFVAAFCGGLAFRPAERDTGVEDTELLEQVGGLASQLVWLVFGAVAVPIAVEHLGWRVLLYAVLSLTLLRIGPVALATMRAGLDRPTVLFVGWFGPRGLASLVFALLALSELGQAAEELVAVVCVTVLLSVLAHGLSASALAARYGAAERRDALRRVAG